MIVRTLDPPIGLPAASLGLGQERLALPWQQVAALGVLANLLGLPAPTGGAG